MYIRGFNFKNINIMEKTDFIIHNKVRAKATMGLIGAVRRSHISNGECMCMGDTVSDSIFKGDYVKENYPNIHSPPHFHKRTALICPS